MPLPTMRLEREGRNRWLVVKADPDTLWPKVRQFVQSNGLLISCARTPRPA